MINLTNLIALFRHHRKMVKEPCLPTCFCHRVEEIIKEETEPKPKPKVVELVTRREKIIDKLCKHADSLDWGPAGVQHEQKVESPEWGPIKNKPDSYDVDPGDRVQESIPPDTVAMGASMTVVPAPKEPVVRDGNVFYLGGSKCVVKEDK